MAQKHQLAAIMFTDIVGYTRLMGSDEDRAMQVLKTNREIHKHIVQKYHGKWLKEMGDGVLASFKTASEAVYCAGALVDACKKKDIALRIGIHMGEVIEEQGDIFGDGVNVASRIESLAKPGTILVSDPVHRSVKNKKGIESHFVDERELKNVDEPVKVYSITILNGEEATTIPRPGKISNRYIILAVALAATLLLLYGLSDYIGVSKSGADREIEKSIAVLPFNNLSTDEGNQYFADGLVEDLLNRLTLIEEFKVISRTSSDTYRERGKKKVPDIAKELGVSYIVEGSVQKHGNKARVTVQLIDAQRDDHIWFKTFDRDLVDLFEIQREIAMQVASGLSNVLSDTQIKNIQKSPTENPKAFEYYQLGRFNWYKRTVEGLETAIGFFEQSIAEDPEFAYAYAGLADAKFLMYFAATDSIQRRNYRVQAEALAKKALKMDDHIADAYNVLGGIYSFIDNEWEAAERSYLQGLKYFPNHANLHHRYSEHLVLTGRHQEARQHVDQAIELNPISFIVRSVSAHTYAANGSFEKSLEEIRICHELIPNKNHWRIINLSIELYCRLGHGQEALQNIKSWDSIRSEGIFNRAVWDSIYHTAGIDGLVRRKAELSYHLLQKADLYALIGEDEKALQLLDPADRGTSGVLATYSFRRLYDDPRFIAILDALNLPWEPDEGLKSEFRKKGLL